jgi:hypothetical protein
VAEGFEPSHVTSACERSDILACGAYTQGLAMNLTSRDRCFGGDATRFDHTARLARGQGQGLEAAPAIKKLGAAGQP